MENIDDLKALEGLGLPEKAAHIYLVLLRRQKLGVAEIARESGVKRATCYEYLDLLLAREFVTKVPVGKRTLYAALPPTQVLTAFKKRSSEVERALAELEAVHDKAVGKPKIAFYEGKRAIKRIYEETFTTIGDIASIFPPATFFESFTEAEYDEFDKLVAGHAFTDRSLFVPDKFYKKITKIRAENAGAKKLGKKLPTDFKSNVDVLIAHDRVALISLRDLSALVIESRDIAELFRSMHSFIWRAV